MVSREQDRLLGVGKYADIEVLAEDIRDVNPMTTEDVTVLATMMNGRFTHREGL
jgi:predicted amidohydrolase YtcJ